MRLTTSLALAASTLLVCGSAPPPAQPRAAAPSCETRKILFTRENGCQNDGSVEFCLPKDSAVVAKARQIAPAIRAKEGRGRAGCHRSRSTLYLLPTAPPAMCEPNQRAMTEAGWNQVCRLAALPEVERIVATRFE